VYLRLHILVALGGDCNCGFLITLCNYSHLYGVDLLIGEGIW